VSRAPAPAKLNLALVVGPARGDGKHEVATVLQRIDLADRVALEPAPTLEVRGFRGDTIVRDALMRLAAAAEVEPRWHATITKRIPVAAGLGGGS
jgi:4-diphosphocytidyl-2-C-methyl-D-erythritol kinase